MMACLMRAALVLCVFNGVAFAAPEGSNRHPAIKEIWRLTEGLAAPESVVVDRKSGALFVSSMNGKGDAVDGNGYLSRVSDRGALLDQFWLSGLDAPKGLAISGGMVFGTDIKKLFAANLDSRKLLFRRTAEQADYFNDTAADKRGGVWVTDARGNGIWHVSRRGQRLVHAPADMLRPNGLTLLGSTIFVLAGSAGEGDPGDRRSIRAIAADGQMTTLPTTPPHFGAADGLESDGRGGWFVTTNAAREVIHVSATGESQVLATLDSNTTDLHFDVRLNRLYVPLGRANALVAFEVIW